MSLNQYYKSGKITKPKRSRGFVLLVGVLLITILLLGGGGYGVYRYQKLEIEPLSGSLSISEGEEYISWMFLKVDKLDLTRAKVEEVCVLFFSHHTYEIRQVCLESNVYLEDKTKFETEGYIKLEDIFIDTYLRSSEDILPSVIERLEEIIAINIDRVTVFPDQETESLFTQMGVDNSDLSRTIEGLVDIGYLKLLTNYSVIRELTDESFYGNFDKQGYLKLVKYFREYKYLEVDVKTTRKEIRDRVFNKYIEYQTWDELFKTFNFYEDIQFEQAQVEILNASDKAGYAAYMKRWFEHLGIRVIRVDNAPGEVNESCDGTQVYIPQGVSTYPKTAEVIRAISEKDVQKDPTIYPERPTFVSTGDIVVLLCGVDEVE
jgi:hypothetical protein